MGIISPVGSRLDDAWHSVCEGISGISLVDDFDTSAYPTRIAGLVKDFEVDDYLSRKEQRQNDPFIHYGVAAAINAINDAGLEITEENGHTIGIAMGSGIGGIKFIEDNLYRMLKG
jgi:3-oxoacyl-[acyl-carrier-protein] synthase II